jgi:hypothetical protein
MLTTFDLTQKDIDDGIRQRCNACPVALCVLRKLGLLPIDVHVTVDRLSLRRPGENVWAAVIPLPDEVTFFIVGFDDGEPSFPMSFELDIPEEFLVGVAA